MKRITRFLSAVALFCGFTTTAQAGIGESLPRGGWSIQVSSDCDDSGSGRIAAAFDGDNNTFWHSNWAGTAGQGAGDGLPEWFVIDLGEETELGGFGYRPRNNVKNGFCKSYRLFVSNEPFNVALPTTAENEAAEKQAVIDMTGATAEGAWEWPDGNMKKVAFDAPVKGRYVMFAVMSAGGDQPERWANCAEFELFAFSETVNVTYNFMLSGKLMGSTTESVQIGSVIPAPVEEYDYLKVASYDAEGETAGTEDRTVTVQLAEDLPFMVSTAEKVYPYVFNIHSNKGKFVWKAEGVDQVINTPELGSFAALEAPAEEGYYWYIKGSYAEGFTIHSLLTGDAAALSATATNPMLVTGDATKWNIVKDYQNGGVCFTVDGTNYVNRDPNSFLAYWTDNDAGSGSFMIAKADFTQNFADSYLAMADAPVNAYGVPEGVDMSGLPALLEASQADDFDEAAADALKAELQTIVAAPVKALPAVGEKAYVRITSAMKAFPETKGMQLLGDKIGWASVTDANIDAVLCLEGVEGGYLISSPNAGLYLTAAEGGAIGEAGTLVKLNNLGGAQFNVVVGEEVAHTLGHQSGAGVSGNLTNWAGGYNSASAWYVAEATSIDVALEQGTTLCYATLCAPFAVKAPKDNEGGVRACIAKNENDNLKLVRVADVPANNGVVITGAYAGLATLDIVAEAEAHLTGNVLVGTNTAITLEDGSQSLVFRVVDGIEGFYYPETAEIKANTAYYENPNALEMVAIEAGSDVTGIVSPASPAASAAAVYDLSGRRVVAPAKGIYVKNGCKYIVK